MLLVSILLLLSKAALVSLVARDLAWAKLESNLGGLVLQSLKSAPKRAALSGGHGWSLLGVTYL